MSKAVKKVITKVGASLGVVKPVKPVTKPANIPEIHPAAKFITASADKKDIYDSAARRVRRGRAAGYRSLMTDKGTLGDGGSTLG